MPSFSEADEENFNIKLTFLLIHRKRSPFPAGEGSDRQFAKQIWTHGPYRFGENFVVLIVGRWLAAVVYKNIIAFLHGTPRTSSPTDLAVFFNDSITHKRHRLLGGVLCYLPLGSGLFLAVKSPTRITMAVTTETSLSSNSKSLPV